MEVNYLKLDDKVYAISEIQAKGIDINAELKEFYEQRHEQLAEEFGQVLNDNMQEEWDTQIAHLRKFEDKGEIKIPKSMFDKPLIVFQGRLMPIRVVIYAPNEVATTKAWLADRCRDSVTFEAERWSQFENSTNLLLKIKPKFHMPLILAYDKNANNLYTPHFQTFHTMNGGKVCTGNHTAADFWKLTTQHLQREINRLNTFSPAVSSVTVNGTRFAFHNIITNETIIEVRGRGDGQWQVS